jgi:hypothetical protein
MKLHDHSPSAAVSAGASHSVGPIRASTASLCAWSGADNVTGATHDY